MSQLEERPEEKRELTGIARAVDALFHDSVRRRSTGPGDGAPAEDQRPAAEDERPAGEAVTATHETPASLPAFAVSDESPPLPDEPAPLLTESPPLPDEPAPLLTAPPLPDEPPPLPDEPAPLLTERPPLPDAAPPRPDARLPRPSEVSASADRDAPGQGAVAPSHPSNGPSAPDRPLAAPASEAVTDVGVDSGHAEVRPGRSQGDATPLDVAVTAFLEGNGSPQEVTRLAEELVEQNSLDPVARAVTSLVLAAGDPPDAGLLAIADRLMSPVVLGRLVRRMAADPGRRLEYVRVVRTIGRPMSAAIRDDLAESVDPVVRDGHVAALVGLGEQARTVVEEMAESDNRFLVRTAVEVLGTLGGSRALPLIRDALANADARVRSQSLRSLQALDDHESESLIIAMLQDADGQVRTTAAGVAAQFGLERAVGRIVALLDETSAPDETIELLDALGRLGDPGAVPSIEKHAVRTLFSKPPGEVRIAAYRALHRIGTPHAKELLRQAASDKDPRVGAFVRELGVSD